MEPLIELKGVVKEFRSVPTCVRWTACRWLWHRAALWR